jgi:hypothetical protein
VVTKMNRSVDWSVTPLYWSVLSSSGIIPSLQA